MTFSLSILGSSSALPTSKRFPTAHLLNVNERFFLIDCGEGTQIQLRKFKVGFAKLNHIFISHVHGDHVFGLFGLLSTLQLLGRQTDLFIYGPDDLRKILDFYLHNYGRENNYRIVFTACPLQGISPVFESKDLEVSCFPLKHRVPTVGYLFREKPAELNLDKIAISKYKPGIEDMVNIKKGEDLFLENGEQIPNENLTLPPWKQRSYAYVSDTLFQEEVIEPLKEVDLLFHEATFENQDLALALQTRHSTAQQAARFAINAGAKKLLLGHFSSRYKNTDALLEEAKTIFPNSFAVNDGDVYSVPREREH